MRRSYEMRVVSLGDLVLDVVVRAERELARDADTPARISVSAGGQGANVAAWVAELGGRARWLGKRAADPAGRLAAEVLAARRCRAVRPGRAGAKRRRRLARRERRSAVDVPRPRGRGAPPARRAATPTGSSCDHLHVSGYALLAEPVASAARRAVELARAAGRPGQRRSLVVEHDRGGRSTGIPRARDVTPAGRRLRERGRGARLRRPLPGAAWILKRGARGCSFDGDERPALPVDRVVDTTGAGDALAAGYLVGGPTVALEAAARCVARLGSMP